MNDPKFSETNMTNCPTEDILLDYTTGHLDPARKALFEFHAEAFTHCSALRAAQTAVWRSLDEWKPEPVSSGFNREFWRRVDADAKKSSWHELVGALQFNFWKRVAPVALGVALVVTAFVFDHSGSQPGKAGTPSTAAIVVTASEADQLERELDDIQLLREVDAASAPAKKPDAGVM